MLRRPKGDGRCIHCREELVEKTRDHVFPSSWYPDSTPPNIQRWVAPSCKRCNGEFGAMETELFVRFAACIDPRKPSAKGLWDRAKRTLGIGVSGSDEKEKRIREGLKNKIFGNIKPYSPVDRPRLLPGLSTHPGFPAQAQFVLDIPGELVDSVSKKILRGCEYWLADGRIIEPPYDLQVYAPLETPEELRPHLKFGPDYLGPGCRIRRAIAGDDPNAAVYEIEFWETMKLLFIILPSETVETKKGTEHDRI
jgi:hypothetical protein